MNSINGRVTQKDLYNCLNNMESKLDKHFDKIENLIIDNSKRITTLEYWKANITGKITMAVVVIASSFSTVINFAWDYIRSKIN